MIKKKEKKGKFDCLTMSYTTCIETDAVSDNAVGLSTLSHTKTVASYEPDASGIHDNAGLKD